MKSLDSRRGPLTQLAARMDRRITEALEWLEELEPLIYDEDGYCRRCMNETSSRLAKHAHWYGSKCPGAALERVRSLLGNPSSEKREIAGMIKIVEDSLDGESLKPCPCGGKAILKDKQFVGCGDCSFEAEIRDWNRRAAPAW